MDNSKYLIYPQEKKIVRVENVEHVKFHFVERTLAIKPTRELSRPSRILTLPIK